MKVKMLRKMAGPGTSYFPGTVYEIDDENARRLIDRGYAVAATSVETAAEGGSPLKEPDSAIESRAKPKRSASKRARDAE